MPLWIALDPVTFLSPEFLWIGILAIPTFVSIFRSKRYVSYFRSNSERGSAFSAWKVPYSFLRALIGALIVLCASILLADPRLTRSERTVEKDGVDLAIVLDLSKSMLAEDVSPNRIEAAKRVIAEFVSKRDGDRFALVAFAGKPFLLSPLTDSKEAFSQILLQVTTDSIRQEIPGLSGTAIGDALLLATEALSGATREKAAILVTDGEANVGIDPKPVAAFAAENGIKIFSVGIGDPRGIELFVTDKRTLEKKYFIGADGKPIRAVVDEALMKYVSSVSSGEYGLASDAKSLERVFERIGELTKTEIRTVEKTRYQKFDAPFLFLLSILLVSYAALRRKGSEHQTA